MTSICAHRVESGRPVPPMETIKVEEYDNFWYPSGITSPGDDIWTKFGIGGTESIYPTPPLSPENKQDISDNMCMEWQLGLTDFYHQSKNYGEDMSWHAEHSIDITPHLELDSELDSKPVQCTARSEKPKSEYKVSLIQDCMWSAYKKMLLQDSEKTAVKGTRTTPGNMYSEFSQPSDCVDPTTVFPYPLSMTETHLDLSLGIGAQSSSHSDSDEEIDVVTIATIDNAPEVKKESSKKESHRHKHRRIYEVSNPEHDYAKPGPKHFHKMNRSLKRSKNSSNTLSHSLLKRKRPNTTEGVNPIALTKALEGFDTKSRTICMYNPASSRGSSKNSSSCSSQGGSHSASDSEDSDKRVNHNVLERKRREDLRGAFFRLRDRIPELESKERASKVVILEKSRTYVMSLRKVNSHLAHEKDIATRKHKELLARLRKLRTR